MMKPGFLWQERFRVPFYSLTFKVSAVAIFIPIKRII